MIVRLSMVLAMLLLGACVGAPAAPPSPSAPTSAQPTLGPTATATVPTASPSPAADSAFYLRAWQSQALPPRDTFAWLPLLTVADGLLIDGNVAVPAIYPGPLMITPLAHEISDTGVDALIAEAGRLGLLNGATDFTGGAVMPGSRSAHLELVIDGRTHTLTGVTEISVSCDESGRCEAEPGTPAAFTAFWRELESATTWLEPELGAADQYEPERVALLLGQPPDAEPGIDVAPVPWPFETPLAETGVEFPGGAGERCVTLIGAALEVTLPILQQGTQLTVFVDDQGTQAGLITRVLVPGEESPCPDED